MNDRLIQAYGRQIARRTIYSIAIGILLCFCLFCMVGGIVLLPVSEDIKLPLFLVVFILFFLAAIGGTAFWVFSRNRETYRQLDRAFCAVGLTGSRYLISGRQYQGTVRGRKVNVYYYISSGRTFRTPDLTIYIEGNFNTRLGIGSKNILTTAGGTLAGQTHLELNEPAYDELLIYPLDETWSRNLLVAPQARDAVTRMVGKDTPGTRGVIFAPQSLKLQIRHFDLDIVTPDSVREWIDDMLALTEIGEGLLPPTQTAQSSDLELASQSNRAKFLPIALGIVAVMIICPAVIVGGVFLAIYLLGIFP